MEVLHDILLSEVLWYKIGGKAKTLLKVANKEDVIDALNYIKQENISNVFICGTGSNLVFNDNYYDGAVIQFVHGEKEQISLVDENTIEAFAGEILGHVIELALSHNLIGLEFAGGLPGTVGAAVRGNVGAYGGETKDVLESAEILLKNEQGDFEIKTLTNSDLKFVYRGSIVKENKGKMIILSARYKLKPATADETTKAREVNERNIQQRKDRHPLEYPNCGSVFKNINEPEKIAKVLSVFPDIAEDIKTKWYGKVAAGYLIKRLGLQGFRVGDAQVSNKHALFIVNLGHAKATDVLSVIETIQNKFMETFGFKLEPEVEIVN